MWTEIRKQKQREANRRCYYKNKEKRAAHSKIFRNRIKKEVFDHYGGICACQRHHIFFKRQYPDTYMRTAREVIGEERSKLLDRVIADKRPHRMYAADWEKELAYLKSL